MGGQDYLRSSGSDIVFFTLQSEYDVAVAVAVAVAVDTVVFCLMQ